MLLYFIKLMQLISNCFIDVIRNLIAKFRKTFEICKQFEENQANKIDMFIIVAKIMLDKIDVMMRAD